MSQQTASVACAAGADTRMTRARSALPLYLELAKARLCLLVLATTLVGFLLASGAEVDWARLGSTLAGTALAAFGANALNQCSEVRRDARMARTRARPLPSGNLRRGPALAFALGTSLAGPLLLAGLVNGLSAALAAVCLLTYLLFYTPLKSRTPLNTLVGALVGALPPMMGWAAATGRIEAGAWLLAGILFFWQIPHFLSLAWLYREDYARGGLRMLPVVDRSGHLTCYVIILYSLMLLPLGLAVTLAGISGLAFATGSLVLGGGLLASVLRLDRQRTSANARRVFLASVAYLSALLGLMVLDRTPAASGAPPAVGHGTGSPARSDADSLANVPATTRPAAVRVAADEAARQPEAVYSFWFAWYATHSHEARLEQ